MVLVDPKNELRCDFIDIKPGVVGVWTGIIVNPGRDAEHFSLGL